MKKKVYTRCEIKVISVCTEDVLMASGEPGKSGGSFLGETDVFGDVSNGNQQN